MRVKEIKKQSTELSEAKTMTKLVIYKKTKMFKDKSFTSKEIVGIKGTFMSLEIITSLRMYLMYEFTSKVIFR